MTNHLFGIAGPAHVFSSDQRTLAGQKAGSGGIVFISESGDSLVRVMLFIQCREQEAH